MIGGFYFGQIYYGGVSSGGVTQIGASLQGDAQASTNLVVIHSLASSVQGDGQLSTGFTYILPLQSSLSGDANFIGALALGQGMTAFFEGDGSLTSTIVQTSLVSSSISGDASVDVIFGKKIRATFTSDGELTLSHLELRTASTAAGDGSLTVGIEYTAYSAAAFAGDAEAFLQLYPFFDLRGDSTVITGDLGNWFGIEQMTGTGELSVGLVRGKFLTRPTFVTGQYGRGARALDGTLVVGEEEDTGQYARGKKNEGVYEMASSGDTGSWTEP